MSTAAQTQRAAVREVRGEVMLTCDHEELPLLLFGKHRQGGSEK